MKLSLTFQPFVKPQYKEFCINKIQHAVTQIKRHFNFSLKQHIYQQPSHQSTTSSKLLSQSMVKNDLLNKTVKKNHTIKANRPDGDFMDKTENINFFHIQAQPQSHSKYPSTKPNQPQLSQNIIEQQQLVEFLQKVQLSLAKHNSFYKKIMEKIQFMNKKQAQLQKLTAQLKAIKRTPFKAQSTSHFLQDLDLSQQIVSQDYMTFRDNQFIPPEKDQKPIESGKFNDKKKYKKQFESDKDDECGLGCMYQSSQKQSVPKSPQVQSPLNFIESNVQNNKQNEQGKAGSYNEDAFNLEGISQNADFLISFMKLEQQYNKIKRKSQFKKPQQCSLKLKNRTASHNLQNSSKIQFTYAH